MSDQGDASNVSRHMHSRLHIRVGQAAATDEKFAEDLWRAGRPATAADHSAFFTWPKENVEYRIAVKAGVKRMIARSLINGVFVTIMDDPGSKDRRQKQKWRS